MNRTIIAAMILLLATGLMAQTKAEPRAGGETVEVLSHPVQSLRTHLFDIEKFTISFGYEHRGFGEILTAEFGIRNKTDNERELYIYTIATEDVDPTGDSTFKRPREEADNVLIRNFVPFPVAAEDNNKEFGNMKHMNFRYKLGKDSHPLGTLRKFPHDPKLGIDPSTGKAYKLNETLFVKTQHHSKYRKNYLFFNHVTLLIFDAKNLTDEKGNLNPPLYRQIYRIEGKRK